MGIGLPLNMLATLTIVSNEASGISTNLEPIQLPDPERDGGKSVLAALWARKTIRNISPEKLPPQILSNLIWAAFGINREEPLHRPVIHRK